MIFFSPFHFPDSATKHPLAVTAATWCAAIADTTRTQRNWWNDATVNITGAAMSLARSVKGW